MLLIFKHGNICLCTKTLHVYVATRYLKTLWAPYWCIHLNKPRWSYMKFNSIKPVGHATICYFKMEILSQGNAECK